MSNKFSSPSLSVLRAAPQYVPLTDICQPKQWKTIPKAELKTKGYPVYGANGLIGYSDEYNHENKTILIACRGASCGAINVCLPKSYVTGNAMCLDNLNEEFDLDFLQHFLQTYDFKKAISGSAQPQITRSGLSLIMIPILPVSLQRKISCILSAVDENKKQAEQTVKYLDSLIKSRFVEMFGDPTETNKQAWNYSRLGDVLLIERGGSPRPIKSFLTNDPCGINWIKIGDAIDGSKYITRTKEKIKKEGVQFSRMVHKGDFLLSNSMSFGRPYILNTEGCIHDGWLVLRDEQGQFDSLWLYEALSSQAVYEAFKQRVRGGVVSNLNKDLVSSVALIVPPLALQQEFAAFVAQVDKLRFEAQQQIEKLETLKKSLMQEYFG